LVEKVDSEIIKVVKCVTVWTMSGEGMSVVVAEIYSRKQAYWFGVILQNVLLEVDWFYMNK